MQNTLSISYCTTIFVNDCSLKFTFEMLTWEEEKCECYDFTVWKFHNFFITQILREIKIGESRVSNSAISAYFEALKFDF